MKKLLFSCFVITTSIPFLTYAETGEDIAQKLEERYSMTSSECIDNGPDYKCSGIVLSGSHDGGEPWHAPSDGSMSYSYLRKDLPYGIFSNYGYGIILVPEDNNTNQYHPNYRCAYPINGASDGREDNGCGQLIGQLVESAPCQSQGIFDAEEWFERYQQGSLSVLCGFDLASNWGDTPKGAFEAVINSEALYFNSNPKTGNNEIVIESWFEQPLSSLPIEAIFYAVRVNNSHEQNLANLLFAQEQQASYVSQTGMWIPIIHMEETLQGDGSQKYDFSYNQSEQGLLQP